MNRRISLPGSTPPALGDIITTNYYPNSTGIRIIEVFDRFSDGTMGFKCQSVSHPDRGFLWLYGYRMVDGRCLGNLYLFGSAGHHSQKQGGIWNWLGFDEIGIIERAEQPALFASICAPARVMETEQRR